MALGDKRASGLQVAARDVVWLTRLHIDTGWSIEARQIHTTLTIEQCKSRSKEPSTRGQEILQVSSQLVEGITALSDAEIYDSVIRSRQHGLPSTKTNAEGSGIT